MTASPGEPVGVDELAQAMFDALRQGQEDVVLTLAPHAIHAAAKRPRLLPRILAWQAQALMNQGQAQAGHRAILRAQLAARRAGDTEGLAALAPLAKQLTAMAAALLERDPGGDGALAQALHAIDAGDVDRGVALAQAVLATAAQDNDARGQVMAWLTCARHPAHTHDAIRAAAEIADRSDDKNLVTAVARAAKAAGLSLETKVFLGKPGRS